MGSVDEAMTNSDVGYEEAAKKNRLRKATGSSLS